MTVFYHNLPRYFSRVVHHRHPENSILYHTSSLDVWPSELVDKPDRFVEEIEACVAHTTTPGHDGCPPAVDKDHEHMFLRVTLASLEDQLPQETIFVERVLKRQEVVDAHAVIPVTADEAMHGLVSPEYGDTFHDHACVVLGEYPAALVHAHRPDTNRTINFSGCPDRRLSLLELATVLRFVSAHGLRAVSLGYDTECETYSRWFCRASIAALTAAMRGAFRHWTPPKGEVETQREILLYNSVEAWIKSTFETEYPLQEVADENLTRQMDAMTDEEREHKLVQIAKRKDELDFKAGVEARYRELMMAKSRSSI